MYVCSYRCNVSLGSTHMLSETVTITVVSESCTAIGTPRHSTSMHLNLSYIVYESLHIIPMHVCAITDFTVLHG